MKLIFHNPLNFYFFCPLKRKTIMLRFLNTAGLVIVSAILFTSCLDTDPQGNDFAAQWRNDTTAIGLHVRNNNIPALKDISGVYFQITQLGKGFPPRKINDEVRFEYKVSILGSSTIVEESDDPQIFNLGNLIPGMQVGLSLMPPGTKAKIFIPSGFAYGEVGGSGIPPNSNLQFEIELISVTIPNSDRMQLNLDTLAIDKHVMDNEILNVIKDSTGLRYIITEEGIGSKPTLYNKVRLKLNGKILSNGTTFFDGTSEPTPTSDSRVIGYVYGIQAALTKFKIGTKATLFVPSTLGFGNKLQSVVGGVSIPANSNLLYEIELIEIVE
jgi:FKBP-type peptidyl-prolyl cis-trans isomerase